MTLTDHHQHVKDNLRSIEIKVLSLNIWGIPLVSKNRKERIEAIVEQLITAQEPYHYVFLQEIWSKEDYVYISKKVSKVLPFSHYFHSGSIGSGMCILSTTPIRDTFFHRFSINGYPHKLLHGDWYGGKGMAICRTYFQGMSVLLVNSHFHAEYDVNMDEYIHHRVVQAFEASQFLRLSSHNHDLVIYAGDFNCLNTDIACRLLVHNANLTDSYFACPNEPANSVNATCDSPYNSYTCAKTLRSDPNGKRIDYIFYWASPNFNVKALIYDLPFPPRIPQKNISFSDHEAIRTILTIKPNQYPEREEFNEDVGFCRTHALLDAAAVCSQGIRSVNKTMKAYICLSVFISLLIFTLSCLFFVDLTSIGQFFLSWALMCLTVVFMFYIIMASFCLAQERNSLVATSLGLEKLLDEMTQKNAILFEQHKKRHANGGTTAVK